jgi:hypothetical protein
LYINPLKTGFFVAALLITTFGAVLPVLARENEEQIRRAPAISIVDLGVGADGQRRMNVQTSSADVVDLLRAFFKVTGDQFAIDQDVAGTVDVKVSNGAAIDVLRQIAESARPPIRIRRQGGLFRISRELPTGRTGGSPAGAAVVDPLHPYGGVSVPTGFQQIAVGNRPINLDVPKERPISMAEALARISAQSGINIRMDRRIPNDLTFSGTVVSAPANLVLQTIANEADLKLIPESGGFLVAPTDRFNILLNGIHVGEVPNIPCRSCGMKLSPIWRFCPLCGKGTGRGITVINPPGIVPVHPGPGTRKP